MSRCLKGTRVVHGQTCLLVEEKALAIVAVDQTHGDVFQQARVIVDQGEDFSECTDGRAEWGFFVDGPLNGHLNREEEMGEVREDGATAGQMNDDQGIDRRMRILV